jgi:O-antigen/teichoic acid export membrane protein
MAQTGQSQAAGAVSRLAGGASLVLLGRVAGRALHLVAQVVIARLLGASTFGLFAIGWALLQITGILAPLGLEHAVVRFGSRFRRSDPGRFGRTIFQSVAISMFLGAAIGVIVYLSAPRLATGAFGKPDLTTALMWFAPAIALYPALRVAAAATRVSQRMAWSVLAEDLLRPAIFLGLVLLFVARWGRGLEGAVAATGLSIAAALAVAVAAIYRLWPQVFRLNRLSPQGVRELLSFSVPASLAGLFVLLNNWVAQLIIGVLFPAADVGRYQAASQLSLVFAIILSAFNTALAPMIADLHGRGERRLLERVFRAATRWGLYFCAPVFLVFLIASRDVMAAVYGPDFARGWPVLLVLTIGQIINVATGAVGILLIMTGRQRTWSVIAFAMLVLDAVLILLLSRPFGLVGAAAAVAVSTAGMFALGLFWVRRKLRLWPYDRRYLDGLLAAAIAGGGLWLVRLLEIPPPALRVLVDLTVTTVVFWSVLLLAFRRGPEERNPMGLLRSIRDQAWRSDGQ